MAEQKKSKKNKEIDVAEQFVSAVGKGIISMFLHPVRLIIFGIIVILCISVFKNYESVAAALNMQPEQMLYARFIVFLFPLFLLAGFNSMRGGIKTMAEKFEEIKFCNKVGQFPTVKSSYKDRKDRRIKIYEFNSPGIPIADWQRRKDEIESVLDCNILMIKRDADSKQTAIVKCVSSSYKIPRKIEWEDKFIDKEDFVIAVGEGLLGPIKVNLNSLPHAIVAGTTGSGKSVNIRCMLWQAILKGARLYIIDFKGGVEFGYRWEDFAEVVTDQYPALSMLQHIILEMIARLSLFRQERVKSISSYNKKHPHDKLCHIVLACDELAELLDKEGITDKEEKKLIAEIDRCVARLARLARAAGIYMILGMQRPDAKVLKGQIKNNAPIRICGRAEAVLSEIVLGTPKASEISNDEEGRFFCNIGGLKEFQGYWFEDSMLIDGDYQIGRMLTEGQKVTEEAIEIDDKEYREFEVPKDEQEEWEDDLQLEGIQV